ncbi:GumC family protein [Roseicella frigidaeris]|nr:polysaccharide biosynthesis tyrosine autokinase [Roseicella frigidaeris]
MFFAADANFDRFTNREAFSLSDLTKSLRQRKLLLLAMCGIGALGGLAFSRVLTPSYFAEATMVAEPPSVRTRTVSELAPDGVQMPPDPAITRTTVETVSSPLIIDRALRSLPPAIQATLTREALGDSNGKPSWSPCAPGAAGLVGHLPAVLQQPAQTVCDFFTPPAEPASNEPAEVQERRRLAAYVAKKLQVDNTGRSYTVRVAYTASDPQVAAAMANAVVNQYLAYRTELTSQNNEETAATLEAKLASLSEELRAAERNTQQMREQVRLQELRSGALTQQQATELMTGLLTVRMKLTNAEARLDAASKGSGSAGGAAATEVLSSPTIQQLRKQEAELDRQEAQLSSTLGPSHPNVRSVRQELSQTRRLIAEEVSRVTRSLQTEVNAARRQEVNIVETLRQQEKAIAANADAHAALRQAERQATALAQVYDHFLLRQRELNGRRDLPELSTRLLSAATVPLKPNGATASTLTGLGGLGGLLIGSSIAVYRGRRQRQNDPVILGQQALSDALDVTYLPKIPHHRGSISRFVSENPYSPYAEALHWARASLQVRLEGMSRRVIMVTSSQPGEGKSSFCMALAAALTLTKQTAVVVDCDLRKPQPAALPQQSSHLTEWRDLPEEDSDLEVRMYWAGAEHPNMVRFSAAVAHPHVILSSPKFRALINSLAANFDYVILDTPPLSVASDSLFVGYNADECLMVTKWRSTPLSTVRAGVADLRARGIRVSGLIVNQAEMTDTTGLNRPLLRGAASADASAYRYPPRAIPLDHSSAAETERA